MSKKQAIDDVELSRKAAHANIKSYRIGLLVATITVTGVFTRLPINFNALDALFPKTAHSRVVHKDRLETVNQSAQPTARRLGVKNVQFVYGGVNQHYQTAKLLLRQHKPVAAKSELVNAMAAKPFSVEVLRDYCTACADIDAADVAAGEQTDFTNMRDMLTGYERLSKATSGQVRYVRLRKAADETIPQLRELLRKHGGNS